MSATSSLSEVAMVSGGVVIRGELAVEIGLEKAVPPEFGHHAHHWLILHGRYTCKALRPECGRCLQNDLCDSPDKRAA